MVPRLEELTPLAAQPFELGALDSPMRSLMGGIYYGDLGYAAQACNHFRRYLRDDPGSAEAVFELGHALVARRRYNECKGALPLVDVARAQPYSAEIEDLAPSRRSSSAAW